MDQRDETRDSKRTRFSLSQETITILAVGVALSEDVCETVGMTT